jgi:tRNA(fMet)-specific endonuclease VapC
VKYLFDTDHISILHRRSGSEFAVLSARIARYPIADLALSVVSFHEQVLGSHKYIRRAKKSPALVHGYQLLLRLLSDYAVATVLPFNVPSAAVFDGLRAQKIRVSTMDLRIASIALAHGMTLLTRNVSDFQKVPGLITENWTV